MSASQAAGPSVSVAIIDDHDVIHAGIRAWCAEADPPIRFVGDFLSPTQYFERYPGACAEVDVVLLDLQIEGGPPEFGALHALSELGQRVIVFSHMATDEVILTSLELGATTYLAKSEGQRHLIDAIHAAHSSTPYVGPRMAKALAHDQMSGRVSLSQREKEVLVAWFQTESKELVGKQLYIAPTTVRTHLQRVRAKYAAVGRTAPTKSALLARAVQDGILSVNDL